MLNKNHSLAIFMEGHVNSDYGKMGFGLMRYAEQPITCVIDSENAGKNINNATSLPFEIPIVESIQSANDLGAEVLVLGIAPSGGKFPESWEKPIAIGLGFGMSLVNGLHDNLNKRFGHLLKRDQWIWDIRQPAFKPAIAAGRASNLNNKRVLLIGTDMAVGKMTTALELHRWAKEKNISSKFLATGQIGMCISGGGIPLDAFIVDRACGAVEHMVLEAKDADLVFVEGQGSLLHPGSTATLPLMRGSCPTHLVLCHRANMTQLRAPATNKIPDLKDFIKLNEDLVSASGSLPPAKTIGISVNTSGLSESEALECTNAIEMETGIPTTDVVRFGAEKIGLEILKDL